MSLYTTMGSHLPANISFLSLLYPQFFSRRVY